MAADSSSLSLSLPQACTSQPSGLRLFPASKKHTVFHQKCPPLRPSSLHEFLLQPFRLILGPALGKAMHLEKQVLASNRTTCPSLWDPGSSKEQGAGHQYTAHTTVNKRYSIFEVDRECAKIKREGKVKKIENVKGHPREGGFKRRSLDRPHPAGDIQPETEKGRDGQADFCRRNIPANWSPGQSSCHWFSEARQLTMFLAVFSG